MSCAGCIQIPEGAVVIHRASQWCRVAYRLNGIVTKVLRESVTPHAVRRIQKIAAENPDWCEPFDYDLQTHTITQRDLGDDPPTAEDWRRIHAGILESGLRITDLKPDNIRGGKLIDFDCVERPHGPRKKPAGVIVKAGGKVVSIYAATQEQLASREVTPLIRSVVAANTTDYVRIYRQGSRILKVLKPTVRRERIRERLAIAKKYPDLIVPFSFDEARHTIHQEWLGDEEGSLEDVARLEAAFVSVGELRICDIHPKNIRKGRLIDFDLATELIRVGEKVIKKIVRM